MDRLISLAVLAMTLFWLVLVVAAICGFFGWAARVLRRRARRQRERRHGLALDDYRAGLDAAHAGERAAGGYQPTTSLINPQPPEGSGTGASGATGRLGGRARRRLKGQTE